VRLSITTWNINSVRLRIDHVTRFLSEQAPDVLCLQETKCPIDKFPEKAIHAAGYEHIAFAGMKGYNGVAIISRYPVQDVTVNQFCEKEDARQISLRLGPQAGEAAGLAIHNFYVPAGGDVADPAINPKFAHKLQFLEEMRGFADRMAVARAPSVTVGDLNIAPLEHDVWSHKQLLDVVSHTPLETSTLERLREEAGLVDSMRVLRPEPEKIYSWWSYRSPDWNAADKGRRLDHVWLSPDLAPLCRSVEVLRDARGWERPSDHAPVTAVLEL
jgi:exodeoxyribonuclease-3